MTLVALQNLVPLALARQSMSVRFAADQAQPLVPQYLTIAGTMVAVDLLVMAGYTGLAARVLRLLRTPRQQRRMNRTFAGLFLGAATLLATIRRAPV